MKIGILTFHSQLNYGGVLQCWALQTALENMGHEVVVIDRLQSDDNFLLERGYDKWDFPQWLKFWIRSALTLGGVSAWRRVVKTKRFIRKHLRTTQYHFVEWKDAPKDLGVDMLVVGSDQVWHCGDWGDPRVYLLDGAPNIPAIAYAASFGLMSIPTEWSPVYKSGLQRFAAIACREKEGVGLCRELGVDAAYVVDPTLLAWFNLDKKSYSKKNLVCYFMSEQLDVNIDALESFAIKKRCRVKVFVNDPPANLPRPKNVAAFLRNCRLKKAQLRPHVTIMSSAAPDEFIAAFKTAMWVVSDSYHALMFSICFGGDARILRPKSGMRKIMFSRIEEFAAHVKGNLIVDSVNEALDGFLNGECVDYNYDWLTTRVAESREWLRRSLTINP